MNVRNKIGTFPILTIILVLLVGLVSYRGFAKLGNAIEEIYSNLKSDEDISNEMIKLGSVHANAFKVIVWTVANYPAEKTDALVKQVLADIEDVTAFARNKAETSSDQEEKASYARMLQPLEEYREWIVKSLDMAAADTSAASMFMGSVQDAFATLNAAMLKWQHDIAQKSLLSYELAQMMHKTTLRNFLFILLATTTIAVVLALLIAKSIVKPITRAAQGLSENAKQAASASAQVSLASQQLAEGALQQAGAIEETSSALEEAASMTRQNAENAKQADVLAREASKVVDAAEASMKDLAASIDEVSKASEATSKIIKTIDEIAFQTNLLALNAAVEAARAGEAGAGFAVVADEVRNLAMRAAEAAKNTAELIEGTARKAQNGSHIVGEAVETFQKVTGNARKIAVLVGEIAVGSNEQTQGIDQINRAVSEMDKVVQQNAVNAEETASASVKMNAQTEQVDQFVRDLIKLVGAAKRNGGMPKAAKKEPQKPQSKSMPLATEHHLSSSSGPELKQLQMPPERNKEMLPHQVIPLEEDFKDF